MVTITLQFTYTTIDGKKVYKPSSKMSQLFCITKNIDAFDEEGLNHLKESGYQIVIEENDLRGYSVVSES